jgi:phosphatidylglycerophosphate synthase
MFGPQQRELLVAKESDCNNETQAMGDPILITSFDARVFYPMVIDPFIDRYFNIFVHVHPNYITLFNFLIKYLAYVAAVAFDWKGLLVWGTMERFLDCLDGRVARRFQKCSDFGHHMDKVGDLVFRFTTAIQLVRVTLPLFAVDFFSPFLLLFISVLCPSVYIYDAFKGRIINMETQASALALVIEDNATLLCVIFPLLQWLCVVRCGL